MLCHGLGCIPSCTAFLATVASCGSTYAFGIYSTTFKSSQGYDQCTLERVFVLILGIKGCIDSFVDFNCRITVSNVADSNSELQHEVINISKCSFEDGYVQHNILRLMANDNGNEGKLKANCLLYYWFMY